MCSTTREDVPIRSESNEGQSRAAPEKAGEARQKVTLVRCFSEMVSGARWARLKTCVLHGTGSFCALTATSKSHTCTHRSADSFHTLLAPALDSAWWNECHVIAYDMCFSSAASELPVVLCKHIMTLAAGTSDSNWGSHILSICQQWDHFSWIPKSCSRPAL